MKKIAIHSVPRSGSTWLGNIFNSHPNVSFKYQPLFSYAFKGCLTTESSLENINNFFNEILRSKDGFINQLEGIEKGIIPIFKKSSLITHNCYKEVRYHYILENLLKKDKELKVLLLVRNPLAVLNSWYHAPKEFRIDKGWVFDEEWQDAPKKNEDRPEEFNGFNKWKEATEIFLSLKANYSHQVYLLNYTSLIKNTVKEIEAIFKFVDLDMSQQTLDFIKVSTTKNQDDAYSVYKRRKNDDAWGGLPSHVINYIKNDLKNTDLEQFIND